MLVVALLVLALVPRIQGLNCYTCTYNEYIKQEYCFIASPDEMGIEICSASDVYCHTHFTISDGVTNAVERRCSKGGNSECKTVINKSENPTSKTDCWIYCDSDNCNDEDASGLQKCSKDCSGNGQCDYITGTCLCYSGFEGTDCSKTTPTTKPAPARPRNCYQCSTEYEDSCESLAGVESMDCLNGESYCSTTRTAVYDQDGEIVVKNVTTRGCTNNYVAVDECSFSSIDDDYPINSAGYKEFTCYSTCDKDRCNNNTADGIVNGGESVGLYCLVCNGTDCGSSLVQTLCPSDMTYCKSSVKYLITENKDRRYKDEKPEYELLSIVRECAKDLVKASCVEKNVEGAAALKRVTCTETCQEDGCNTGWPARPKCVQCNSDYSSDCIDSPDFPEDCDYPYQGYCYIYDEGIQQGVNDAIKGYPRRMVRGCSHYDRGTSCASKTPRDTAVESCNRTCTTDGCNVGNRSEMPLQTLEMVLVAAVATRLFHAC